MESKIFTLAFNPDTGGFRDEDFKAFCASRTIISSRKRFFVLNGLPYWTVFLEYEAAPGTETRTVGGPTPEEKGLYDLLRQWRREIADKAGVPPYLVCTNNQLLEMIRKRPKTLEGLKTIRGFGDKKAATYGGDILGIIGAGNGAGERSGAGSAEGGHPEAVVRPDPLAPGNDGTLS